MQLEDIKNTLKDESFVVRLLNEEERLSLQPIFTQEFDNSIVPDKEQANILGVFKDGELQSFILCEFLLRVGLVWVNPELRQTTKAPSLLKKMFAYLFKNIPKGASVVSFLDSHKYSKVIKMFGLYKVEGEIYRIDL